MMPRDALPHGHLHLVRPQRGDRERGDTLSLRAQPVEDEGSNSCAVQRVLEDKNVFYTAVL